jgi:hypothetical protein
VNELPEPVTLASGVPEPHWAWVTETRASSAPAKREKLGSIIVIFVASTGAILEQEVQGQAERSVPVVARVLRPYCFIFIHASAGYHDWVHLPLGKVVLTAAKQTMEKMVPRTVVRGNKLRFY